MYVEWWVYGGLIRWYDKHLHGYKCILKGLKMTSDCFDWFSETLIYVTWLISGQNYGTLIYFLWYWGMEVNQIFLLWVIEKKALLLFDNSSTGLILYFYWDFPSPHKYYYEIVGSSLRNSREGSEGLILLRHHDLRYSWEP